MTAHVQLRRFLPIFQTMLALVFGGWGLWLRYETLSHSWLGWNSDARFHVWPWPFKFAAIVNMPADLLGLLVSWPLDVLLPRLPEALQLLPSLVFVPLLWYLVGTWLDKTSRGSNPRGARQKAWGLLLLFMIVCAVAASIPTRVWGEAWGSENYFGFGLVIWIAVGIGIAVFSAVGKRQSKKA